VHAGSRQRLNSSLEAVSCGVQFIAPCFNERLRQPEETLLRGGIGERFVGAANERTRAVEITPAGQRERLPRVECTEVTRIRREGL
jgi:hypothetical protein